jgi:MoaA/NifB/PqqE/SkfB family radical SAM enzyme
MTMNGTQLFGLRRLWASRSLLRHPAMRGLTLKQKLALMRIGNESKLTRLGDEHYTNTFTPYFPSPAYDRFLQGTIDLCNGRPVPVVTNFAVTPRCCCSCWHCSFSDRSKQDVLGLAEIRDAIAQVQELGAAVIGFTGGEPLLRDDLEEMISSVGERSMPIFFTTGYQLQRQRIRALRDAGLKIPVVSLDHYTAEVHDRGRGREGIFDHAVRAIELFKEEGFYVAVSFVPDRALMDDTEELYRTLAFFRQLGVNDMRLTSPILSGQLVARPEQLLSADNVRTIFEIQRHSTRTRGEPGVFAYDYFEGEQQYGCVAGYGYMFIDSQGNICPCDFAMLSFGNLLERPIAEIWQETSAHFRLPGLSCYANRSNDVIARSKPEQWPLRRQASQEILSACPPYDPERLPAFFKAMGLSNTKRSG